MKRWSESEQVEYLRYHLVKIRRVANTYPGGTKKLYHFYCQFILCVNRYVVPKHTVCVLLPDLYSQIFVWHPLQSYWVTFAHNIITSTYQPELNSVHSEFERIGVGSLWLNFQLWSTFSKNCKFGLNLRLIINW